MCTDIANINNTLKKSFEYSICRKGILIYGILVFAIIALFAWVSVVTQYARFMLVCVPSCIIYIPFVVYQVYKMRLITKAPEHCVFCETKLTNPQPGMNASLSFFVTIRVSRRTIVLQTRSIGTMRGMIKPHLSELNNRCALVSYNQLTKQLVVIKLL